MKFEQLQFLFYFLFYVYDFYCCPSKVFDIYMFVPNISASKVFDIYMFVPNINASKVIRLCFNYIEPTI